MGDSLNWLLSFPGVPKAPDLRSGHQKAGFDARHTSHSGDRGSPCRWSLRPGADCSVAASPRRRSLNPDFPLVRPPAESRARRPRLGPPLPFAALHPKAVADNAWSGPGEARFAVVYHFYSLKHKHRLRMVVPVEEAEPGQPCRSWPLIHAIWAGEPHCRQCSFSAASCCTSCLGAVSRFAITGSGATPVAPNSSRPEHCLTGHPPRASTSQILPSRLIRPRLSHFKTTVPIAGSVASSSSKHSLPN